MGWKDKRLLLPSVITVFTNFLFGTLLMYQGMLFFHHDNAQPAPVHPSNGSGRRIESDDCLKRRF
jgi:hypothetical protein